MKYALWMFATVLLILFFVFPFLTNYAIRSGSSFESLMRWLDTMQWLQTIAMHCCVYVWVTFLGSCFASFLNVVAWRVPRGRSILGSSHCPHCDYRLPLHDNVPIFGWLNNNGQCRNCAAPIAVRYLIVELLLGLTFLLLFLVEVVSGGVNLPVRPELQRAGIEFVLFTPNWFLISTFVYHATLMCGLFTFAVIASEHKRVPASVVFCAAIFLIAIASTWAHVIQVPWCTGRVEIADWPPDIFSPTSLHTMAIGIVAGSAAGVIAWVLNRIFLKEMPSRDDSPTTLPTTTGPNGYGLIAAMALVGLALGWQSTIAVLALWVVGKSVLRWLPSMKWLSLVSNSSAVAMFATILHLLFWRLQMPMIFWLNE